MSRKRVSSITVRVMGILKCAVPVDSDLIREMFRINNE